MIHIHAYASPPEAFLVNSFLIETPNGVVVIDTQFLVTPAKTLKQKITALGKPILGVIITHPHPDHYNGTAILLEGLETIPIYSTEATYEGVKATETPKREFWTPTYQEEYPKSTLLPTHIVTPGKPLIFDGVALLLDDLGAGEASDITVIYLPEHRQLIASDLVYYRVHPWLAEGRSQQWLKQLELVKERYSEAIQVFNGHGEHSTLQGLDEQVDYITSFRDLVDQYRQEDRVGETQKAEIRKIMLETYPTYPLDFLIEMNVDGVAKELGS
ncbi:MBL fold metallo-hydrolase [Leptolyngbya sp. AN03gr2]|uniref:MBL fold metallo-hydrolase n=1 Tax=unclassified Leptolyngbya TaxID=2650499 RepID=UPI003D314FF9